tara:strand:- start:12236 stop:12808 length:573 start_codon:yes stop_codon:yes gene_type:complete
MKFKNTSDLVNKINTALGAFCKEFGSKRKELANVNRAPQESALFKHYNESNDWAINQGGATEIQYFISFDSDALEIRYGLGFNTQFVPHKNEMSAVEYMQPFMDAFLKHETQIKKLLPEYNFVYGNEEQLKNPQHNQYTLFGKIVQTEKQADTYFIKDSVFNSLIEDLKTQFEAYQIIFKERNNLKETVI